MATCLQDVDNDKQRVQPRRTAVLRKFTVLSQARHSLAVTVAVIENLLQQNGYGVRLAHRFEEIAPTESTPEDLMFEVRLIPQDEDAKRN